MHERFEALIEAAANHVAQLRKAGRFRPTPHVFVRFALDNYRYGEKGPEYDGYTSELFEKEVWWGATLEEALAEVAPVMKEAFTALPSEWQNERQVHFGIARLFEDVVLRILEGTPYSREHCRAQISLFEQSLRRKPVGISIQADLHGIAVLTEPIDLKVDDVSVRLRALKRGEFEAAQMVEEKPLTDLRLKVPIAAVLEIKYQARDASGWQRELDRTIAVLELFGVSEVGYTAVQVESESIIEPFRPLVWIDYGIARPRTYAVREPDRTRLETFWDTIVHTIPEALYYKQSDTPEDLAATHLWYRQAVGRKGLVNFQLSEVVRALESAVIESKEKKNINATLNERVSTLLSTCGLDRQEVSHTLKLAYNVRSRYVHGDQLSNAEMKRIDDEAGGIITLFRRCLDYLRLVLVACIAATIDKKALIAALAAAKKGQPSELQRIAKAFQNAVTE